MRNRRLNALIVAAYSVGLLTVASSVYAGQTPVELANQIQSLLDRLKAALGSQQPTSGPIAHVAVGGSIQTAIDAASPGTTILVDPAGTYRGFVLRNKGANTAPIVIAPERWPLAAGARVTPTTAGLYKLTSPDLGPVVTAESGATGYVVRGCAPQPFGAGGTAMVQLGDPGEGDPFKAPNNITIDQCLLLADPVNGGRRGIAALTRSIVVSNSYIAGFFWSDDAQAIIGWNGPGPFAITNNYLEASGENVMFGGADAKTAAMMPQNLVMRGNYLAKPLVWRGKSGVGIKNLFELKAMSHAVVENNVFENTWANAQSGYGILFTVRNQEGTAPWSTVSDVTFQYNIVRHVAGFVSVLGKDDTPGFSSVRMSGLRIRNNLAYDIDPAKWSDPVAGSVGAGRVFQLLNAPLDIELGHNTALSSTLNSPANVNAFLFLEGAGDGTKLTGLNVHDNLLPEGAYGMFVGSAGCGWDALATVATTPIFTNNVIVSGKSDCGAINYGPLSNTVTGVGATVVNTTTLKPIAAYQTTDGKAIGADIDAIKARIPWLTLP